MTRSTKTNTQSNVAPKRVAKTIETPTIVLKSIHDAIMRDDATSTLTTKKMRVRLRASPTMRAIHVANASWIFTQSQCDDVRAMFDAKFAQRIAQRAKRDAKKNDAPKRVTSSHVDDIVVANVE